MRLILASGSATRKKAMDALGMDYEVIPSTIDEKSIRHNDPKEQVTAIAEAKAREVGQRNPGSLVVAGDLFVVFNGKIYEKPSTVEQARANLLSFSGNRVTMLVALAVYNTDTNKMLTSLDVTFIDFRELTEREIDDYVSTRPVTTYAAGFGPDGAQMFSKSMDSEMFVTALPISKLKEFLRTNGLS
ncbi:MAG: Maf family nucleotide pyrophosphatase [Candidatus Aenigmatarchaeota archaeon]